MPAPRPARPLRPNRAQFCGACRFLRQVVGYWLLVVGSSKNQEPMTKNQQQPAALSPRSSVSISIRSGAALKEAAMRSDLRATCLVLAALLAPNLAEAAELELKRVVLSSA